MHGNSKNKKYVKGLDFLHKICENKSCDYDKIFLNTTGNVLLINIIYILKGVFT